MEVNCTGSIGWDMGASVHWSNMIHLCDSPFSSLGNL